MKVALLQYCATENKEENLRKASLMALEALNKGAEFVLLPEVFNFRGNIQNSLYSAEKIPGESTALFAKISRKHKAHILLGSMIEKAAGQGLYNTSVLLDPQGKIAAKYRKINLFKAHIGDRIIKETNCFRAGKRPVRVNIQGFNAGLSICYDLRFPGLYQQYARKAADIITAPSCFTRKTGHAHWEILLRARAVENLAYVLAPNQIGTDVRDIEAHGHSMVVSPWGEVLAQGSGDREEIIYCDININAVEQARKTLPGIIKES